MDASEFVSLLILTFQIILLPDSILPKQILVCQMSANVRNLKREIIFSRKNCILISFEAITLQLLNMTYD